MSGLPHRALLDPLLVVRTLEDALYVYRRDVDLIGFDLAHLDQVLHFRDGDARRRAHHRAEISGGLAEDEVAPLVALPGAHDGVVGLERLLEDHLAAFEHPAPPARMRSASVPCGLSSTSSLPARNCRSNSLFSPT